MTLQSSVSQTTKLQLQLMFFHFYVTMNATNTATGLWIYYDSHQPSLYDVKTAHILVTTATTTVTMTHVPATRSATVKVPQFQLNKCKATQAPTKDNDLKHSASSR